MATFACNLKACFKHYLGPPLSGYLREIILNLPQEHKNKTICDTWQNFAPQNKCQFAQQITYIHAALKNSFKCSRLSHMNKWCHVLPPIFSTSQRHLGRGAKGYTFYFTKLHVILNFPLLYIFLNFKNK